MSEKKVELSKLTQEELPEELRGLSTEELDQRIADLTKQRKEVQAKIKQLSSERANFVATERGKLADKGGNLLDEAIVDAVRTQASRQSFQFGE